MESLESFDRAIAVASSVIGSITDRQLRLPTPCSEWTVRDILNHVLLGDLIGNAFIHGAPQPDRGVDHLGDDPRGAVAAGLASFRAEVASPGTLDRHIDTPMGNITVRAFLDRRVADLTAHLWDLSKATGQPTTYDPELNMLVLAHYKSRLDGADRTGMPVADMRPVTDDATAADRLAAYLGREPSLQGAP
jgi:uncharacterized protein (TIGR03086 family)